MDVLLRSDEPSGVVTLTLNRPAQFNALSDELLAALAETLASLARDERARVVVLAGAGRAFSAGHDLREMRAHPEEAAQRDLFERCSRVMLAIQALPQPVIARVHGIATAAGCQLVAACDLAVAEEGARFGVSGVNVGLFCTTPSVALARNIGRKQAFEMLVTGELIDARSARERGLVNRVVPLAELDAEVARLAAAIVAKSAVALRLGKRAFYQQLELGTAQAYALASQTMAENMAADDAREGIDAFLGKRAPVWRGR
jgi:enoyl-CoA hydratase/carnithine racemase